MKTPLAFSRSLVLLTAALTLVGGLGCRTSANYQQADKTGKRIKDFRKDVIAISDAVNDTQNALDQIVQTANTDPRKAYKQLTKCVSRLEDANAKSKRRAEDMRAEGRIFFAQWQQEIALLQNPDLQQLAQDRRAVLEQTFRNISRVTVEARDQLRPWMNGIRDLHRFLGTDLTIGGISASRQLIEQNRARAEQVTSALETLIDELNSLEAAMTPASEKPNRGTSG